jgi:hypothetical protein
LRLVLELALVLDMEPELASPVVRIPKPAALSI